MLYELTDYTCLTEFSVQCGHLTISATWKNLNIPLFKGPFPALGIEGSGGNYSLNVGDRRGWIICEYFTVNESPMFLYQSLPKENSYCLCILFVPTFSSKHGNIKWIKIDLSDGNRTEFYYTLVHIYPNGIILRNPEWGSLTIVMKFTRLGYILNNQEFSCVVPTIVSKTLSQVIPYRRYISTAKHQILLSEYQLPPNLEARLRKNHLCYKYGEYYMLGRGDPEHILVEWNISFVKYMSKKTRLYIQYILMCIKRKKLATLVPKILWTTYILPIVIFHIPTNLLSSTATACTIC